MRLPLFVSRDQCGHGRHTLHKKIQSFPKICLNGTHVCYTFAKVHPTPHKKERLSCQLSSVTGRTHAGSLVWQFTPRNVDVCMTKLLEIFVDLGSGYLGSWWSCRPVSEVHQVVEVGDFPVQPPLLDLQLPAPVQRHVHRDVVPGEVVRAQAAPGVGRHRHRSPKIWCRSQGWGGGTRSRTEKEVFICSLRADYDCHGICIGRCEIQGVDTGGTTPGRTTDSYSWSRFPSDSCPVRSSATNSTESPNSATTSTPTPPGHRLPGARPKKRSAHRGESQL